MAGKAKQVSRDLSIDEASEYWDTHSVADHPSRIVSFEYVPGESRRLVAIQRDLLDQLDQRARESGVSMETLVNRWILEKLSA